jgi:Flp pilus assembly protein CpaB
MRTIDKQPAAPKKKKSSNGELSKLLSSRGGLAAVALFAAVVAAALLTAFLNHYKHSIDDKSVKTVLVAKDPIPQGASGDVIAGESMFQTSRASGEQVKPGALTDPAALHGKVAAGTIYPGQQLTAADFSTGSGAINTKISGYGRAISVPVDTAHGMVGDVHAGDHVDVYASFNSSNSSGRSAAVVKVLIQNALVLKASQAPKGSQSAGNQNAQVILQTPDKVSPQVAFTVDNGKVWIAPRAPAGAKDSKATLVTQQSILAGVTVQLTGVKPLQQQLPGGSGTIKATPQTTNGSGR